MVLQNQCGTWGLCGVAVYWQGSLESWSALAYKQHAAIPQTKTAQNNDWPKGVSHGIHTIHDPESQIESVLELPHWNFSPQVC
jgi:hypothetical protein